MEPFVVSVNAEAQGDYRRFWRSWPGTLILIAPGIVFAILGVVLGVLYGQGANIVFAGVLVLSGLYGVYAGLDHRRKSQVIATQPPLAFTLDAEGAEFPRHKRHAWSEARFVLTDEVEPRILCSPVGLAYAVASLDRTPAEIDSAIVGLSGGARRLDHSGAEPLA